MDDKKIKLGTITKIKDAYYLYDKVGFHFDDSDDLWYDLIVFDVKEHVIYVTGPYKYLDPRQTAVTGIRQLRKDFFKMIFQYEMENVRRIH